MGDTAQAPGVGQVGWRFGVGVILVIGGYVSLALIPLVAGADIGPGLKTGFTGFLALMPVLTKVAAIAVMGKPGFNLLKAHVFKFLGRFRPAEQVSRRRYRVGLILFVLSILFGSLLPYLPGIVVNWQENEVIWSLVADALLIASLFVLGGEFWNKLAALFDYNAKVSVREGEAG
jgi:hypothetical protein